VIKPEKKIKPVLDVYVCMRDH